jgi:hypothetical protein
MVAKITHLKGSECFKKLTGLSLAGAASKLAFPHYLLRISSYLSNIRLNLNQQATSVRMSRNTEDEDLTKVG